MPTRLEHGLNLIKAIGPLKTLEILARRAIGRDDVVHASTSAGIVRIRTAASDLFVAGQVFGAREYALPETVQPGLDARCAAAVAQGRKPLIVDAGANTGYAAMWFSTRFPSATILAVEPDDENYAALAEQVRDVENVRPIHGALWSHDKGVRLARPDAPSWAKSVDDDGADTPSFTLETLMGQVREAEPLLLKIDVEGAENEICQASPQDVASFPFIVIEPHDFMNAGGCSLMPMLRAIQHQDRDVVVSGENLMFYEAALVAAF